VIRTAIGEFLSSKGVEPAAATPDAPAGQKRDAGGWLDQASAIVSFGSTLLTGRTGDPQADEALGAFDMVLNVFDADKLMDQGRKNGDAAAMDQAIKLRPGDWTYHTSRAVLALRDGDTATREREAALAGQLATQRGMDEVSQYRQLVRDYDRVIPNPQSNPQCRAILQDKIAAYSNLARLTGDARYEALTAQAQAQLATCP
jgi:hypothetical protein